MATKAKRTIPLDRTDLFSLLVAHGRGLANIGSVFNNSSRFSDLSPRQVFDCWQWSSGLLLVRAAICLVGIHDLLLHALFHLLAGRHLHKDLAILNLCEEGGQVEVGVANAIASSQVVGGLVDGISQCQCACRLLADQSSRDHPRLPVRAKVLRGQPLVLGGLAGQVENRQLLGSVFHRQPAVRRVVSRVPREEPLPAVLGVGLGVEGWADNVRRAVGVGVSLAAHVDVLNLLGVVGLIGVCKLLELLAQLLVIRNLLPLAMEVVPVLIHHSFQIRRNA
mmetsp:Transcript_10195/g.19019  ORF Transcript_10195/g.19019 Transcript_10195/m.19019 type:complete len:279 (-) Transcript_10195:1564-2400(-)